jgi:GNAT superfamily N-acetyltransferase
MTRVRPATPDDSEALQQILNDVWRNRPPAESAYFSIAQNSSAWVALESDRVVGFAGLQQRPWHPHRTYLSLHVLPAFQRRGVGTALWRVLEPHIASGRAQTAAPESFLGTRGFLERVGFKAVMSTWTVDFDPAPVLSRLPTESPVTIRSYSEIPEMRDQLAQLHHEIYTASHAFNPPLEATTEQMNRVYMAPDDLEPEDLFVAFEAQKPIGLSSLRGDVGELELWWIGALGNRTDVTLALFKKTLERAVARGESNIGAELDSLDPHAMAVLETLGVPRGEAWLTYQK